ncbi:CGNR zinc finger domain-containing protein [Nocardioides sp. W3-2-3]|nr:CGNR zinc finger domain-containing protein [Nocardioides convexus]
MPGPRRDRRCPALRRPGRADDGTGPACPVAEDQRPGDGRRAGRRRPHLGRGLHRACGACSTAWSTPGSTPARPTRRTWTGSTPSPADRSGPGSSSAEWAARAGGAPSLPGALAAVAADAVDLLGGADADRLHECEGPTCDLVFVDASRAQRRRWCSGGSCGNRSRVAHHRRRQASGA